MNPEMWSRLFGDEDHALAVRPSVPPVEIGAWSFAPGIYSGGGGTRRHTIWISMAPLRFRVRKAQHGASRASYMFDRGATTFQRGGDYGSVSSGTVSNSLIVAISAEAFAEYVEEAARTPCIFTPSFGDPNPALADFVLDYMRTTPLVPLEEEAKIWALFTRLLRLYCGAFRPLDRLRPTLVERIDDYVRAHLSDAISLQDLADTAEMSRWRFARAFACTTGDTPHRYVMRQRCDKALHLCAHTALPLAEIASDVGFVDQSHLTKWMKRTHGATPRKVRQGATL